MLVAGQASAQVELKTYAISDGYLDVQKLTCAQLAGTFQEDADYLAAWYSGRYNGLGKKHLMQVSRANALQQVVIVHCKANLGKKVIDAILKTARSGQIGDGKIFVTELSEVIRIRTGETGGTAL